jgi:hypothetical protein
MGVHPGMGRKSTTVIALVGGALVAAIALPSFVDPRGDNQTMGCIANLKQIQGAAEQYALENKLVATNTIRLEDLSGGTDKFIHPLINVGLVCPSGGTYSITTVGEPPRGSIPGHTL